MWNRAKLLLFVVVLGSLNTGTIGYLRSCCPSFDGYWKTGFYELGHDGYYTAECKDGVTSKGFEHEGEGVLQINFQPKNQFGTLGVSFCQDNSLEDCYVAEIFGVISGHMGYEWRKQSRNETGKDLWVPGKNTTMPSTFLKEDRTVDPGTWDPEGRTVYQFYVQLGYGNYRRVLYNGGNAEQQKEMAFWLPKDGYYWVSIQSYKNEATVSVEGAKGCLPSKRFQLEPNHDIWLYRTYEPSGVVGLSLCTDSSQFDCYVLEVQGMKNGSLKYFWRKHSAFEKDGEAGWVPGRSLKTRPLKGIILSQQEIVPINTGEEASKSGINLYIKRTLDEKLEVGMNNGFDQYLYQNIKFDSKARFLKFDIPPDYQYGTAATKVTVGGRDVDKADLVAFGPCFNGNLWGYVGPFCKHEIPARDPSYQDRNFYIYSPRPGLAEAEIVSEVLESKATRKTLCMSLLGIASHRGASLSVTATDASGKSNATVYVGQLTYNHIYPPVWQRVRISVELPDSLQTVPLIVKVTAKRKTAQSTVFISEARLCSDDGCGLPSAKGTPYIANGKKTSPAKYPWHIAIFKTEDQIQYNFICGGTLIRSDVVLSAAHCFVNNQTKIEDKTKFKIAAGKVYNSLYEYEPNQQFSDALDIKIPAKYTGTVGNYINDIAIVRVNFTTTPLVLPACVDWFKYALPVLNKGLVGQVAGWGATEKSLESKELLFGTLPFIPYSQCIETVPQTFVGFVTPDKFCAGNVNGTTVKKGDSGGGLVFKTGGLWYIRGIVSTGVPDQLTYSTFTDVAQYIPWMKEVLNTTDGSSADTSSN